ncbi:MAG TPA: prepilin-type N-terminal cleavage/methylation domain-containing protein, partial [Anaeromyxobacter sp.]
MRTHRPAHGVTLVELLITVAVTLIVISGAVVGMNSQQRAYNDGRRLRDAQTSGRRALLSFEKALPSAGFGMDAALAFDFQGWTTGPCPTQMSACPLDATANSDELVFFSRDPRYWTPAANGDDLVGNAWRIKAVTTSSVTIRARAGDSFAKGQIFLAVCPGSSNYAYFTSDQNVAPLSAANDSLQIQLKTAVASNPFLRQDAAAAIACFTSTPSADPARLFLINKYRFHVRPAEIGTVGTATQYDPLLVLDRGLDGQDEVIVAEGIESLQVAYSFYQGTIGQAGTTVGTAFTKTAGTAATATSAANTITTT